MFELLTVSDSASTLGDLHRLTWRQCGLGGAGWLVVLAAFAGVMAGFGSLFVFTFGVFLKPVSAEFGWTVRLYRAASD